MEVGVRFFFLSLFKPVVLHGLIIPMAAGVPPNYDHLSPIGL